MALLRGLPLLKVASPTACAALTPGAGFPRVGRPTASPGVSANAYPAGAASASTPPAITPPISVRVRLDRADRATCFAICNVILSHTANP
jgi:hypothetical protein